MAAVFPVSVKSSRKHWTLYNGIKGPLKSFCSEVAEDDCPDAQVVLAKELLHQTTDQDADAEENARLGVYWLMKASEQGHQEATTILRHCLETGQGMSEHNFLDVKACLAMSREEKLARRAAKEVFARLSSGEDFISSDQLQDRMKHLEAKPSTSTSNETPQQDSKTKASVSADWKERCNNGGEKLTEDMLVSAASTYSRGELPLVQRSLSLDSQSELRHNFLCSVILLPFSAIHSSCRQIINTIGRHSYRHIWPIVMANIQAAIMVSLFLFFGLDGLISMLPTAIYFGSLIVMVVTTCQALSRKQDFHLFRRWSNLFIAYSNGELNAGDAEYQYCRNNTQPFIIFFVALIVHLLMTPSFVAPHLSSPQSEITVVAFIFTFLTLYNFTISPSRQGGKSSPDVLALLSFGVHVLAKYPYETDTVVSRGWRFIDVQVPTFASYIVGQYISIYRLFFQS
ncbi:wolframin-like [Nilaparvata lugens]|uniref:wolframin-like n=1 Tax=Nilaparvata lugens TaxID=108931 RepID=UPI00193CDB59|nr:wolframin-like [Nilaparvata lugens]